MSLFWYWKGNSPLLRESKHSNVLRLTRPLQQRWEKFVLCPISPQLFIQVIKEYVRNGAEVAVKRVYDSLKRNGKGIRKFPFSTFFHSNDPNTLKVLNQKGRPQHIPSLPKLSDVSWMSRSLRKRRVIAYWNQLRNRLLKWWHLVMEVRIEINFRFVSNSVSRRSRRGHARRSVCWGRFTPNRYTLWRTLTFFGIFIGDSKAISKI